MWFSKFFSKNQKPVPAAPPAVGLDDIVKQQINKMVDEIVWSGDRTFVSRNEVLQHIQEVIFDMINWENTGVFGDIVGKKVVESNGVSTIPSPPVDPEEDHAPKNVEPTKLKPLTFTKKSDIERE